MFRNRSDAGMQLAKELAGYRQTDSVVVAIPRGAVIVGAAIAMKLGLPMEVLLTKKIGYPGDPEFAIGAVSLTGIVLDKRFDMPKEYLGEQVERIRALLRERQELYHRNIDPVSLSGKTVIIVDDGIATGYTMLAAIELARQEGASKVVVAVPVAPPDVIASLSRHADEVICLSTPHPFSAIGLHYESFPEVTDREVVKLLQSFNRKQTFNMASVIALL